MSTDQKARLLASKAYGLFVTEVANHLTEARRVCCGHSEPEPDSVLEVAARFHTIKGGAGFFGLDRIAQLASKLEVLLKDPDQSVSNKCRAVDKSLPELQSELGRAPTPPNTPKIESSNA